MPFLTPDYQAVREALLRDIRNLLPSADTGSDSDYFIRASSVASAVEGLYQHQQWIARQIFPDQADSDYLERHANLRGLTRKPATIASGQIIFVGAVDSVIPLGTQAKTADGTLFTTSAAGTIPVGGSLAINAQAVAIGKSGNIAAGTALTLIAAPSGVSSAATITSMAGGTEIETDAALLARLLDLIRRPPAGGNKYDYSKWALSVPGVSQAYVYPLRRGVGTVDVVITSAGGLPSTQLISDVQNYIDGVRPVTAKDSLVLAPTLLAVNVTVQVKLTGITLATAVAQVTDALTGYFASLAPGDTAYKSRIEALISDIAGIVDRTVSAPVGNVVPVVDATKVEWARLGVLTVTLML